MGASLRLRFERDVQSYKKVPSALPAGYGYDVYRDSLCVVGASVSGDRGVGEKIRAEIREITKAAICCTFVPLCLL